MKRLPCEARLILFDRREREFLALVSNYLVATPLLLTPHDMPQLERVLLCSRAALQSLTATLNRPTNHWKALGVSIQ